MIRMFDALCRRVPEVASARRVAERCMVLLVVGNVERCSLGIIATTIVIDTMGKAAAIS